MKARIPRPVRRVGLNGADVETVWRDAAIATSALDCAPGS